MCVVSPGEAIHVCVCDTSRWSYTNTFTVARFVDCVFDWVLISQSATKVVSEKNHLNTSKVVCVFLTIKKKKLTCLCLMAFYVWRWPGGGGGDKLNWEGRIRMVKYLAADKACKAVFWCTLTLNRELLTALDTQYRAPSFCNSLVTVFVSWLTVTILLLTRLCMWDQNWNKV